MASQSSSETTLASPGMTEGTVQDMLEVEVEDDGREVEVRDEHELEEGFRCFKRLLR